MSPHLNLTRLAVLWAMLSPTLTADAVPTVVQAVDLVGQTAALPATNLYTPASTGFFRISAYLKVTTPASISSSLGGATGISIGYADGSDSVSQTSRLATQGSAGTIISTASMNTTNIKLIGSMLVYAKVGIPITIAVDYASTGGIPMAYEAHFRLESLDPPANNVFVADGDSITRGVTGMVSWPNFLTPFPSGWLNLNIAVAGTLSSTVLANAPANVDVQFKPAGKNIVVIWVGTNDGPLGGLTPAQSWANLAAYADGRHAALPSSKIIVVPMVSRQGWDTYKNSLNALIFSNWANHFNGIADVAIYKQLGADGAYANTTYFLPDGIHPTTFSEQTIIEPVIQAAINGF